jgi:hypothetical protein
MAVHLFTYSSLIAQERPQRKNKLAAICDELFTEWTHLLRHPNLPACSG